MISAFNINTESQEYAPTPAHFYLWLPENSRYASQTDMFHLHQNKDEDEHEGENKQQCNYFE